MVFALAGLLAQPLRAQDSKEKPKAEDAKPPAERPARPPGGGGGPGGGGPRQTPEERLKKISEDLGLKDDQKEKIGTYLKDEAAKLRELRDDTALDQEGRRAKMKTIREETDAKAKAILNDEQKEKWAKFRAQGQGGQRRRPPAQ